MLAVVAAFISPAGSADSHMRETHEKDAHPGRTLTNCHVLRVRNGQNQNRQLGLCVFSVAVPNRRGKHVCVRSWSLGQLHALLCVLFWALLFFPFFLWSETFFFVFLFGISSVFCEQVLSPLRWTAHVGAGVLHLCTHFLCVIVARLLKLHLRDLLSKSLKQPEDKWMVKHEKAQ